MNTTTLGGKTVYDPPPGSAYCNFFEETAGASRYGYGVFCLLGADYKALMEAQAKTIDLVMKWDNPITNTNEGITRPVVLGRARVCSMSALDIKTNAGTFDTSFVMVIVYDITYLLNSATLYGRFNVVDTGSVDISTAATKFYPSTLNSGAEYTWANVFSWLGLTAPPSGHRTYNPRNIIFDYISFNKIVDRIAAANMFVVGLMRDPPAYTNILTLSQSLRFYNPGEEEAGNTALFTSAESYLLESTPIIQSNTAAHLPQKIRCIFPAYNSAGTDPFAGDNHVYYYDYTTTGTSHIVWPLHMGDYPAFYDEALSDWGDSGELDAIAAELAPLFFTALSREVNGGIVSIYAGLHDFVIDGVILSIRWESTAQGARTIISRDKIRTFSPLDELYGSLDSIANQSISYIGNGNVGISASGVKNIWSYGGGGEEQAVVTDIRVNGLDLQYKTRTIKGAIGTESDWSAWHTGVTCSTVPATAAGELLNWMGM